MSWALAFLVAGANSEGCFSHKLWDTARRYDDKTWERACSRSLGNASNAAGGLLGRPGGGEPRREDYNAGGAGFDERFGFGISGYVARNASWHGWGTGRRSWGLVAHSDSAAKTHCLGHVWPPSPVFPIWSPPSKRRGESERSFPCVQGPVGALCRFDPPRAGGRQHLAQGSLVSLGGGRAEHTACGGLHHRPSRLLSDSGPLLRGRLGKDGARPLVGRLGELQQDHPHTPTRR